MKRIALIGTDWSQNEYRKENNKPGAISTYRLIYPMRYLKDYYDITYWGSDFSKAAEGKDQTEFFSEFMKDYDLVISKVTDNASAAASLRFYSQHFGVPLIVDIDDNIWEVKEDQPGYAVYHKGSQKLAIASTYVSYADAVFCSTKPLADYVKERMEKAHKLKMETYVLPNCVDPTDYNFPKASIDPNKVVIGWQGSTTHNEDLKLAMPALARLMKEYDYLHIQLLGGVTNDHIGEMFKGFDERVLHRVTTLPGCEAFDQFPELLSKQAWDIAIAPITDEMFNHSKSHIKWMEYAMYEIPCVASNVYPYFAKVQGTDTIRDGITGLLATPDQWYEKLKFLIDHPETRQLIGRNAKEYVTDSWSIANHGEKWRKAIDTILAKEE